MTSRVRSIESESNYNLTILPSEPSSPNAPVSIEALIKTVEELQRRDQLETLSKLTAESSRLQQYIVYYQRQWCHTCDLLQNTHNTLLILQNALQKCFQEQLEAEKRWLSLWRLDDGSSDSTEYYSATGWI